jgi:hypothetical protein
MMTRVRRVPLPRVRHGTLPWTVADKTRTTLFYKVGKRVFLRDFILMMIILPRQARDKHRESTQKETRFLIIVQRLRLRLLRRVLRPCGIPSV